MLSEIQQISKLQKDILPKLSKELIGSADRIGSSEVMIKMPKRDRSKIARVQKILDQNYDFLAD